MTFVAEYVKIKQSKRGILDELRIIGKRNAFVRRKFRNMKRQGKRIAVVLTACCALNALVGCLPGSGSSEVEPPASITAVSPKDGKIVAICNDEVAEFVSGYTENANCAEAYFGKGDHYAMKDLTLEWAAETPSSAYTVALSLNADMSDATIYTTETTQWTVSELYVNTTYYWQVTGADKSGVFSFKTANTPRTISIDGVSNTRDIGGKKTEDGRQIRQGVVYRGANLDGITETGKRRFLETYGIRSDLDLRKMSEGSKGSSPVGDDVRYWNYSCPYYTGTSGLDNAEYYDALASAMRVFADSENYPVYFHCAIGRDRTSMVAMLLLGVCGVPKGDIALDYEMSFFSESGCSDGATVATMTAHLESTMRYIGQIGLQYDGKDCFQRSCEAYLLRIGLTAEEIAAIRDNLIVS